MNPDPQRRRPVVSILAPATGEAPVEMPRGSASAMWHATTDTLRRRGLINPRFVRNRRSKP